MARGQDGDREQERVQPQSTVQSRTPVGASQDRVVIFEPEAETMPREQLRVLQARRLQALVGYVKDRVPLYRERLADVEPGDLASPEDLQRLPFTRKTDLRDTYPFGMLAVPRERAGCASTPPPGRRGS